jgi:hypothetical protein
MKNSPLTFGALVLPVLTGILCAAGCGSSSDAARVDYDAGTQPSSDAASAGDGPSDGGPQVDAAEGGPSCTDAAILARKTAISAPGETVYDARFSADGSTIFYAYGLAGGGGGIRRIDPCGEGAQSIYSGDLWGPLAVDAADVGYYQLRSGAIYAAKMQPGSTPTLMPSSNIPSSSFEKHPTKAPLLFASVSSNLFTIESGVTTNVTATVLGAGQALYTINGVARGFRVTRDGLRAATVIEGAGPKVAVIDLVGNTKRLLDFDDDVGTAGVRPPTNVAWLSDAKTLFVVSFNNVLRVDSTITTKQTGHYVGDVGLDADSFDVAKDDKRYLWVHNGLHTSVAKP